LVRPQRGPFEALARRPRGCLPRLRERERRGPGVPAPDTPRAAAPRPIHGRCARRVGRPVLLFHRFPCARRSHWRPCRAPQPESITPSAPPHGRDVRRLEVTSCFAPRGDRLRLPTHRSARVADPRARPGHREWPWRPRRP
jgi:hypothetical protein